MTLPFFVTDVSPLVLRHASDSKPGAKSREGLLAHLHVLKAEDQRARELYVGRAFARVVRGDHFTRQKSDAR